MRVACAKLVKTRPYQIVGLPSRSVSHIEYIYSALINEETFEECLDND